MAMAHRPVSGFCSQRAHSSSSGRLNSGRNMPMATQAVTRPEHDLRRLRRILDQPLAKGLQRPGDAVAKRRQQIGIGQNEQHD